MNQSKRLATIAVVAIILIAAFCGAALVLNNGDSEYAADVTGNVKVLGNANNDDFIDSHDLDLLKKLADDDEWDKTLYPYADADNDGVITSKDVGIVSKIINGERCEVYYYDIYRKRIK